MPQRELVADKNRIARNMASHTVTHQPGISSSKEYSGSVQYIGGYDGPYVDDGDVFVHHQGPVNANEVPIPMGLEVFEKVSKLVAHQNVEKDEGKLVFDFFAPSPSPFDKRLLFGSRSIS